MRTDLRWALVAGSIALVAALAGLAVPATWGARTTADEPHYLLTALSIAEDGNVDISDELADERWRDFHRVDLPIQERVLEDGRMVSPHDPLLPIVLAPAVAIGGWVGAKALLAVLAAATAGATVLLATRRMRVTPATAGVVTAVAFASWPMVAHATQVYPEMVAGLVVVLGTGAATAARPGRRHALVLVLAVVALPWLAVKYAPVAATLAAIGLWRLRHDRRLAVGAGTALVVAGLVYLAVHQVVWTGWTVYASADHFVERGEFSVVGFRPDPLGRSRRLVGLLLGRDFGLVVWQPAWMLVPAGVALGLRDRVGRLLVVVGAAGWLTATFVALTMQGWWVPGRQVVLVLPVLVVLVAAWLDRTAVSWAVPVAAALAALGLVTTTWLVVDGLAGSLTWVVDFASVGDPLQSVRRALLPDYLEVTGRTWTSQWLATLVLAGLAWVGWRDGAVAPDDVEGVTPPRG